MKAIIDEIITALSEMQVTCIKNTAEMIDTLGSHIQEKGNYCWEKHFPIAIVHTKERIKEEDIQRALLEQGILDNDGFTETKITRSVCSQIAKLAPQYIQQVDIMVFDTYNQSDAIAFNPKRSKDFWKKLGSSDNMVAMVEMKYFSDEESSKIEFELREVIRKRKENSALKDIGFIWIAAVGNSDDAQGIFGHYFHENYVQVKSSDGNCSYWIGWSSTLRAVSMRTFYAF